MAQKEYKRQDNNAAGKVYRDPCKKNGLVINIAVSAEVGVGEKEREKVENYQDLKRERLEYCGNSKW